MDGLPSSIILDIFSRIPIKCLARSRCVSKVWCKYIDDPYLVILHDKRLVEEPILYHPHLCGEEITHSLCFHAVKRTAGASDNYVLETKDGLFLEYLCKEPLPETFIVRISVRGSCNGLICLSGDEDDVVTTLVVVHPLRKELYELPPLPMPFGSSRFLGSYGLGFDASTNTMKMVCVKEYRTMVHVFGTNSWRGIPQVPSYPVRGKAVFSNGFLHWLVSHSSIKTRDGGNEVIWFDVNKEEFGLIDPPKRMCGLWRKNSYCYEYLVDLNGEVGYVSMLTMEVWVLKKHNKEWAPHCRFEKKDFPYCYCIDIMGCWNKAGDMLIKAIADSGSSAFLVYNLKSGVLHNTNIIAGMNDTSSPKFNMYPNTLSSIHGIDTNSTFAIKKTILKESCQHVLSNFH